jgi:hypothetical protein
MFEEYLQTIHGSQYRGLDDDMPDAFDNWIGELDTEELMEYAEQAIAFYEQKAINRTLKEINQSL